MTNKNIYLDYNATTPILPKALENMISALSEDPGNASSVHRWGQNTRRLIDQARKSLADTISCPPEYIIFTSGGSESNNHALRGVSWKHLLIEETAHDSAYKASENAVYLPVTPSGLLDLQVLEKHLKATEGRTPTLVSINLANNETGVIQPAQEIAALTKKYGAYLHLDACQALGKIPLSFSETGADMMTLCAHKMGGPQGIGALVVKETVPLSAFIRGGGQEKNRRSGTENLPAIHGWYGALETCPDLTHLRQWHDKLEANLKAYCPSVLVFGDKAPRLPNTTNITLPQVGNHIQVMLFDLEGFAVSAGSACSSGKVSTSRVIRALCPDESISQTALRLSTGWKTTPNDLLLFETAWKKIFDRTRD